MSAKSTKRRRMGKSLCLPLRISRGYERLQISPADHAAFVLVSAWTGPVGFETDVSVVTIVEQRTNLAVPIDAALSQRAELASVTVGITIFGMNVNDSTGGQAALTLRKRILARHPSIARVPDD